MDDKVQKIGLGTVQFGITYGISNQGGRTSPKEVKQILKTAREKNIQLIDTASAYGNAEEVLGQNDLSSFKVISKFMPPKTGSSVTDQLKKSMTDLQLSSLYGYLAHRPKHLAENVSVWEELKALKEDKHVQHIGVSLSKPDELEMLLKKNINPDIIQAPFNYFDRRFQDIMTELKKAGCEIHARSAFLQGLFFMDIDQLDSYFDRLFPLIKNLQQNVENLPGALLTFVMSQPFIDNVIIGVENQKQLIQNVESLSTNSSLPVLTEKIPESLLVPSNWPS
jgi:aryl-alcohol dehydrogenase-like predicted oxidoreductase